MKLENQVVNLELAKRLKELGVEQESLFNWYYLTNGRPHLRLSKGSGKHEYYSAFTVAELGEMLPAILRDIESGRLLAEKSHVADTWYIGYESEFGGRINFREKTEADARAKMLIYLIEHDIYKLNPIK